MQLVPLTPDYPLVAFDCGDNDLNRFLLDDAKHAQERLNVGQNQSAFRYITVDAYLSAIEFYRKNGFQELTKKEEDEHTRLMFFDMMDVE